MQMPNTKLIKYLLGSLDESQAEEISLRIIADKSFENEMLVAESELIESFLEGSLTPEDAKLFQTNFLINEDRENQLKEIYLLQKLAQNELRQKKIAEIQKKTSPTIIEKLRMLFSVNSRPVTAILTILIVCMLAGGAWRVFFSQPIVEMTQLEKEYMEINRKDLSNPSELTISPIVLLPGALRSAGESKNLESAKLADKVFFRLGLPFEVKDKNYIKAELIKDRKTVFTQNEVRIYKNQSGQEIKLILPKSVLQKGEYQIKLENPNAENSAISYAFVVE